MRVPACAMIGLWVMGGCADSAEPAPLSAAAADCDRAAMPAETDPRAGSWQLVVPHHPDNELGVAQRVFGLLDACESFVSLGHSVGQGGKASSNGPSELLTTAHGEAWATRTFDVQNSFRALAHGGGKWVAVGHGTSSPGAIAVADSLDAAHWRVVLENDGVYFNSVAYGANTFVAVAQNGVAVSSDGERWSWASLPTQALYFEVAFGDGHFVVAGVGAALSSTDGRTWTEMRCQDASMCLHTATPPGSTEPPSNQIALQSMKYVGQTFYGFGASGALASRDGASFGRAGEIPDAAMGGMLLRMPENQPPDKLFASQDAGDTWLELPVTEVDTIDCRDVPCVAVSQGILAFVAR